MIGRHILTTPHLFLTTQEVQPSSWLPGIYRLVQQEEEQQEELSRSGDDDEEEVVSIYAPPSQF